MKFLFKLRAIFQQIFVASFLLFIVSVIVIGFPIFFNSYTTEKINLGNTEMKIMGKQYDPSLRISEGRTVISADCYASIGTKMCSHYHNEFLFGENNQILAISNKYLILVYSEITDKKGNRILINNVARKDEIISNYIERQKSYPNAFLILSLFSMVFFFIFHFLIEKMKYQT